MKKKSFLIIIASSLFLISCQKTINNEEQVAGQFSLRSNGEGLAGAVYTLSNQVNANQVLVYNRDASGELTFANAYPAGGTGTGSGLGSQGAIFLSGDLLLAVNAGSNSISSVKISGQGLQLVSTVPSGGETPISVTEYGGIVYVLNAGASGNISGFRLDAEGHLTAIPNSTRPLSSSASMPAQVSFVSDGSSIVVTEKGTNKIITYTITASGVPGVMHSIAAATATPFGFAVGKDNFIYVSHAAGGAPGASTLATYEVAGDGTITLADGPVSAGQTAACWVAITNNDKYFYATNTGSSDVSSFQTSGSGNFNTLAAAAAPTGADSHPIDAAFNNSSKFLYVLSSGTNTISGFSAAGNGTLSPIQTVSGIPAGAAGLVSK